MNDSTTSPNNPPMAIIQSVKRNQWIWLIPIAAIIFSVTLFTNYVIKTGPVITITMTHGHGLKPGDVLRCRGIVVGQIETANLNKNNNGVILEVRLQPSAKNIARQGSRFWTVRPQLGLSGIGGLETIAGPRYLAVLPGTGNAQKHFVALEQPPAVETIDPRSLEILLTSQNRGSLKPGSPILYRQVRIGTVLSVSLASDASSVQVRAYIQPEDVALVRDNSKFWNVSGAQMHLGLTGLNIELESIASLLDGGIALATPNPPGQRVGTGYRFILHNKPNDQWLTWRPALSVGTQLLPPDTITPSMQRVTITQTAGKLFKRTIQKKSWALPFASGLLIPADIIPEQITPNTQLQVAGQNLTLSPQRIIKHDNLAEISLDLAVANPWPEKNIRLMTEPEDCLILTTAPNNAMPLDKIRIMGRPQSWSIDPAVPLDTRFHGAAILARKDGFLLGILAINNEHAKILELKQ